MTGLEGPVLEGELVPCVAHLHNTGSVTLRSLRLLISEPDLYCCPSAEILDSKITSLAGADSCLNDPQLAQPQLRSCVKGMVTFLSRLPLA